jgi:hypothetical protein
VTDGKGKPPDESSEQRSRSLVIHRWCAIALMASLCISVLGECSAFFLQDMPALGLVGVVAFFLGFGAAGVFGLIGSVAGIVHKLSDHADPDHSIAVGAIVSFGVVAALVVLYLAATALTP